jgi:hypothetical protein
MFESTDTRPHHSDNKPIGDKPKPGNGNGNGPGNYYH